MDNLEGMRIVAAGTMIATGINGPAQFIGKGLNAVRTNQGRYTLTLSGGYGADEYVVMATFTGAGYTIGVVNADGSFDISTDDAVTEISTDVSVQFLVVQTVLGTEI